MAPTLQQTTDCVEDLRTFGSEEVTETIESIKEAQVRELAGNPGFYRQTTGLLPEAHVAFLDQIFKTNPAILNALLSVLNERSFYNAGQPVRVPLCMCFGACGSTPGEEDLWVLYDRWGYRPRGRFRPCAPGRQGGPTVGPRDRVHRIGKSRRRKQT